MARTRGNDGVVKVGAVAVALVTSWSVDETVGTIDGTVLGDDWAQNDIDVKSWTAQAECFWDTSDAGQAALALGDSVVLHLQPAGSAVTNEEYTGTALVTSISRTGSNGSNVTATIGFTGTGALTEATL